MSNTTDLENLLPIIEAIDSKQVQKPDMPVDVFMQEAENLYHWAIDDKDELAARGLNLSILNSIPRAAGACREAEARWYKERYAKREAEKEYRERSPLAYELRNDLVAEFEFAFNGDEALLGRVAEVRDGKGHADMIQDLNNLAVLGRDNIDKLSLINFEEIKLDSAAIMSDQMADILARANGEKADDSVAKTLRDKAYTHLKKYVDEVRRYGKFVFRADKERIVGYYKHYKMAHN